MNSEQLHNHYLHNLIHNLSKVGEDPKGIMWIMKDGIYMPQHDLNRNKLCDLILGYYDNSLTLIELKGSEVQHSKAVKQIESSVELAHEAFPQYRINPAKVVYYKPKPYLVRIV